MTKTKGLLFTAGLVLALAFTVSCFPGGDDDGGGSSSSGGGSSSPSGGGKGNDISNYRTAVVGTQTWMAENLDYAVDGSKCYDDVPANCDKYGRLYNWNTAKTVCPPGWHLPTQAEWDTLSSEVESDSGCSRCDAKLLKATSGWKDDGNGTDAYGFSALPGGYGISAGFGNVGRSGNWWSASEGDSDYAYIRGMYGSIEDAVWDDLSEYFSKSSLLSVRCLQD